MKGDHLELLKVCAIREIAVNSEGETMIYFESEPTDDGATRSTRWHIAETLTAICAALPSCRDATREVCYAPRDR